MCECDRRHDTRGAREDVVAGEKAPSPAVERRVGTGKSRYKGQLSSQREAHIGPCVSTPA
jgi:hypothetical protein